MAPNRIFLRPGMFRTFLSSMFGTASATRNKYLVGSVGDLQNGQMKEVGLEVEGRNCKLLLSRIQDQYYATSHLCSHYKARLVTGSLTSDGRVICPWHAACFNVKTGDIEEAPALESLRSYPTLIEGDKIFVLANVQDFDNPTVLGCKRVNVDKACSDTLVVVGGGGAGAVAAESIRQSGFRGKVILISRENHPPIDRIKLSKILDANPEKLLLYKRDYLEKELAIELRLGITVTKIDPAGKKILLDSGECLNYSKVLIATGGRPRRLQLPGADLENTFVIRGIEESHKLKETIGSRENVRAVVIGASFIGMESAAMLSKVCRSVTIVAPEETPLIRALGGELGGFFQRLHAEKGISFRLNTQTSAFLPSDTDPTKVGGVQLDDGEIIPADIVVLGVGVRPETDLLKGSVELEADGGVRVDEYMKVVGLDDVYAAGDICKFPLHGETLARIEHWDVAQQQGRIAGHNMSVPPVEARCYQSVPFFFSLMFGKSVRYAGYVPGECDGTIIDGDLDTESPAAAVYYLKNGEIKAVATVNRDPLAVHVGELLRKGRMLGPDEIKAGKDPLQLQI